MKWNAWGDPTAAAPLPDGVRDLLRQALGIDADPAPELPPDRVRLRPSALAEADRRALAAIVGDAFCRTDDESRLLHAGGKSTLDLLRRRRVEQDAPDAVLLPADEDEIGALLRECTDRRIAVVPFGGGTSVVGGLDPVRAGFAAVVSLDLRRLDRLVALDEVSQVAEFEAGVSGPRAERLLGEHGFALGHFPQSFEFATIGGFAATRSSGQDSAGYGRFNDMVCGLRAITPAGPLEFGRAPQSAAGPDLRHLLLGSEGTLGVITRVRVRVHPVPETTHYEAWSFPDFGTGAAALRAVAQQGTGPTVIRLSDEAETAVNLATTDRIGGESVTGGCLAITLFEGTAAQVVARHNQTRAVLAEHGGTSLGEEPARAWEHGRFAAPYLRDALLSAGALCETLETATDWSNLSALKSAVTEALTGTLAETGTPAIVLCHISHVYPTGASLYFTVVAAQRGDAIAQWQRAKAAATRTMVDHGGTITHHHAVGTDHRPWMLDEVGELGVAMLRAVKATVDPAGILNPGKLIP
ncbi:FAD-binding oxidoreductase [uncultured Mycolicibacterium sp.]|uniref:FAD-binding oxidoreductase n=1 Tax=uncultured Mycolicibacterium sp. TaxID=2320817 RepID=UPI003451FFFE